MKDFKKTLRELTEPKTSKVCDKNITENILLVIAATESTIKGLKILNRNSKSDIEKEMYLGMIEYSQVSIELLKLII